MDKYHAGLCFAWRILTSTTAPSSFARYMTQSHMSVPSAVPVCWWMLVRQKSSSGAEHHNEKAHTTLHLRARLSTCKSDS